MEDFQGKKVVVLGAGRTGLSVCKVLHKLGADIVIADDRSFQQILLKDDFTKLGLKISAANSIDIKDAQAIIVSPGVPPHHPLLIEAASRKVPLLTDIQIFFQMSQPRTIAITGTNGKTTTTKLVYEILKVAGIDVVLGGNVGVPVLDVVDKVNKKTVIVLEISSFQLARLDSLDVEIGCILNVAPDHLGWHRTFDAYVEAKSRLVQFVHAHGLVVLNHDDPIVNSMSGLAKAKVHWVTLKSKLVDATFVENNCVYFSGCEGEIREVFHADKLQLLGSHNLFNAMAAASIALYMGIPADLIANTIYNFSPIKHRMEAVLQRDGVTWINDSKSTNSASLKAALDSIGYDHVVAIVGGQIEDSDIKEVAKHVASRCAFAVLIGEARHDLATYLRAFGYTSFSICDSLFSAVELAATVAKSGWCVLFSPGFKSYDMFRNYEERGNAFVEAVRRLYGHAD